MTALQENALVRDYVANRSFRGFNLKLNKTQITFTTSHPNYVEMLHDVSLLKEDSDNAKLNLKTLIANRFHIAKTCSYYEREVSELCGMLHTVHALSDSQFQNRVSKGAVQYSDIQALFPQGTEVAVSTSSGLIGGTVEKITEIHRMLENYYIISISIIIPTRKGWSTATIDRYINQYEGSELIKKLPLHPITNNEKSALTERGKSFREVISKTSLHAYTGKLMVPGWWQDKLFNADGRVMVDAANLGHMHPNLYDNMMEIFEFEDDDCDDEEDEVTDKHVTLIKDEDLWRCYNRVQGFSMRLKEWGWLDITGIKPVNWKNNAFDNLVLSPKYKSIMMGLVKNHGNSFTDFIEGKSGGLIFLLSGSPGTGKTLSAEAVAEALHRPLYTVGVGELGVYPDELETRLKNILDLAYQWNAVLLLDEADIFMEARDTNNIQRNAMVSIFLRLLEYYSGIMFLTTNRVKSFDPAFFSRISLAIHYPNLDVKNRKDVWINILREANIPHNNLDLEKLAEYEMNGRNIKNAVRVAQTTAIGENRSVTQQDFENYLALTTQFTNELA